MLAIAVSRVTPQNSSITLGRTSLSGALTWEAARTPVIIVGLATALVILFRTKFWEAK